MIVILLHLLLLLLLLLLCVGMLGCIAQFGHFESKIVFELLLGLREDWNSR